jgi:hypothetical protein
MKKFQYMLLVCSILYSNTPLSSISAFTLVTLPSSLPSSSTSTSTQLFMTKIKQDENVQGGIYRPFITYAWNKLQSSGLMNHDNDDDDKNNNNTKNVNKLYNSSPSKGSPEGTVVNVEIKSMNGNALRLARYALLETMTPDSNSNSNSNTDDNAKNMVSLNQGIHVLNLVLFPNVNTGLPIPILGMDLVTLPGGKHLIAIDFQPILPPSLQSSSSSSSSNNNDDEDNDGDIQQERLLFPTMKNNKSESKSNQKIQEYEKKAIALYEKHVLTNQNNNILPWGGDIPAFAKRFFSPFALWTRLKDTNANANANDNDVQENGEVGVNAIDIVQDQVYHAFCDYFDLYIDLLLDVQNDSFVDENDTDNDDNNDTVPVDVVKQGHVDYLTYRKENDPARPMLNRLYGTEWTDEVISEVLFKMI